MQSRFEKITFAKKSMAPKIFLIAVLTVFFSHNQSLTAQNFTDGIVSFQVTTISDGVAYAPRHCLAIWVKDANGNFVVSRKVMAAARKHHLLKWVASSANNVADAITGPTLNAHTSHTVSWDCRDKNGVLVPDGTYEIWIEYTSRNLANNNTPGPSHSFNFAKSDTAASYSLPNQTYFKDMALTYLPLGVFTAEMDENRMEVYPNPFNEKLTIRLATPEPALLNVGVYDISGRRIEELYDGYWHYENFQTSWIPASNISSNTMLMLRVFYNGKMFSKKLQYQK